MTRQKEERKGGRKKGRKEQRKDERKERWKKRSKEGRREGRKEEWKNRRKKGRKEGIYDGTHCFSSKWICSSLLLILFSIASSILHSRFLNVLMRQKTVKLTVKFMK